MHLAVIPLGNLAAGEYHVDYVQLPMDQKWIDAGYKAVDNPSTLVSRSFAFKVFETPSASDAAPARGATIVPLDQIWALNNPGTQDVHKIDPANFELGDVKQSPTVDAIKMSLAHRRREEKSGEAFVVVGTPSDAVQQAAAVLVKGEKAAAAVSPGTEINLIFYSKMSGRYVHITSVEQLAQTITVKYRFVSHPTMEMTTQFAVIPLGVLDEGEYEVKITQLPAIDTTGGAAKPLPNPENIVCQDVSFRVEREQ